MKGRTVFLITHKLHTLEIADRIVVMDAGQIVDVGTHAELIGRCPLYQRLVRPRRRPDGRVMVILRSLRFDVAAQPATAIASSPCLRCRPCLFVFVLFFAGLGHRDLNSSHEARAAQNAQRMLDTGEWGLPVLFDGRVDLAEAAGLLLAGRGRRVAQRRRGRRVGRATSRGARGLAVRAARLRVPPARRAADRGARRGARAGDREPLHRHRPHRADRRAAALCA